MKYGVAIAYSHYTSPEFMRDSAQLLESIGFDALWVPEHVMFFADYASTYPYSDNGRIPGDPEGVLDPFSALTFIAAATDRIRLGTGICLVPQRAPVYTARVVADLDYLSGGRVNFGVGIGWLKEEFANLQVPWQGRAQRCEDYIRLMKALWSPGESSYRSDHYELTPCHFNPKPVQSPHPPIFFGGESDAALRRVATLGDGWYGFNLNPQELLARRAVLQQFVEDADRSFDDIQVVVCPNKYRVTPELVADYRAAEVDQLIVPLMGKDLATLERRAADMWAMLQA